MNRKPSLHSLILSIALCAAGAGHGSASALTTTPGNTCRAQGPVNTAGDILWISTPSLFNASSTQSVNIVCPVMRTIAAPSSGYSVWLDGYSPAGMSCSFISYNYNVNLLGRTLYTIPAGTFDILMTLPASLVPTYSTQVISCNLPPGGQIFDIEPVQ